MERLQPGLLASEMLPVPGHGHIQPPSWVHPEKGLVPSTLPGCWRFKVKWLPGKASCASQMNRRQRHRSLVQIQPESSFFVATRDKTCSRVWLIMSTTDFFFLQNTKVFEGGACNLGLCFLTVDGRAGLGGVSSRGLGGCRGPRGELWPISVV